MRFLSSTIFANHSTMAGSVWEKNELCFLSRVERIADLDERKNILGYLFVLSRNIALDEIRKRKKQAEWESVENDREYANEENHAGFEVIEKCKELLNEKEFEIVILHVVNAMTHKEIARLKKKPLGTITWAYNHAIKKLKKGWDRS